MALFVLIILILYNCLICLLGTENINNVNLEIKPSTVVGGQNVGFYKVEDTLNLTCTFREEAFPSNVNMKWEMPTKALNSQNRVVSKSGSNFILLKIENLQENDSGDYKCKAVHNSIPYFIVENTVKISVKNKKKDCTDMMFKCSAGYCISRRYTCDGQSDCPNGEDESPTHCGPGNPCDNKLMCPENRCIPFAWCCELHTEPNCNTTIKHSCCSHIENLTRDVDDDLEYQYGQRFSDIGFLQTTVYTVIGCAMAFMFIVTIIVIAICRVHVKRTISHCLATNTNLAFPRGSNVSGNQLNGFPFYDLDLCFNRSGLNGNDLRSVNPLLVAYNINNGVQFVGRPVDPPPYCEIVTSPPKEGPPPPYASHEDLTARRGDKVEEPRPEGREEILEVEAEVTESDALLGATSQSVNVSSSYAIDIVPCVAEDISNAEILDEPEVRSGRIVENILKESSDTVVKSDSSHCDAGVNKIGDNSKNSAVDIVVLGGRDQIAAEDLERIKVQNGESSSYVSGGVSDISKGAVKKIISVKSVDGNSKKKAKTLSKSHFTKF